MITKTHRSNNIELKSFQNIHSHKKNKKFISTPYNMILSSLFEKPFYDSHVLAEILWDKFKIPIEISDIIWNIEFERRKKNKRFLLKKEIVIKVSKCPAVRPHTIHRE